MSVGDHPLTHCERCQIKALLQSGLSKREIARQLGRDPGTISRETSRNRGQRGYRSRQAHGKATLRRREASSVPRNVSVINLTHWVELRRIIKWLESLNCSKIRRTNIDFDLGHSHPAGLHSSLPCEVMIFFGNWLFFSFCLLIANQPLAELQSSLLLRCGGYATMVRLSG